MKFKYIGEDDCFCIELLAYKLVSRDENLKNGQVIEVPDGLTRVVKSLDANGQFVRIKDNKKIIKKEDKE